jgi:hypothetical protein
MLTLTVSWSTKKSSIDFSKNRSPTLFTFYTLLTCQTSAVIPLREKNRPVKIPQKILELLVYVIHPESAACLGDHIRDILNFSRFSCQTGDTWVASITLRSWQVHKKDEIDRKQTIDPNFQNSADDFYLPTNLKQVWDQVKEVSDCTYFKPEVASIVLSTNSFGDFSECTVVAEFINPEKMRFLATKARKVWQKFIHQPQTARCLVFFLLLGNMCEELTGQYEVAIKALSSLLPLDVSPIFISIEVISYCD